MIQDSAVINHNTEKPDITTTTAIRLLLDKAANVEEALILLSQIVFNQITGEARYYNRENYENNYLFTVKEAL